MKSWKTLVLGLAVLVVAGCAGPDRFDNDVTFGGGADAALNDPTSPQFFSQAIGDRVLFEVDQSTLTPEARVTLDAQANWLLTNTDYTATIEGHADERGTREYNIGLSNRRAVAVQDYLISRGVAGNRLTTVGFGKERPVAVCSDEGCYSQNRRGVTILTGASLG